MLASGYKPVASVIGLALGKIPGAAISAGMPLSILAEVDEATIANYANVGGGYVRQNVANAPFRTGAFLHSRRNARAGERLVGVVFLERTNAIIGERFLEINSLVWRPATLELDSRLELASMNALIFARIEHRNIHVYSGRPDPADNSHLTIPYDMDGRAGTIDGWLDPYDRVRLMVRDGPAVGAVKAKK